MTDKVLGRARPGLKTVVIAMLPILSIVFILVAAEVFLRLYHRWDYGIPFRASLEQEEWNPAWSLVLDDMLGWRARAGYYDEVTETTSHGKRYPVMRSQHDYGFRMFGDLRSGKPVILVIGDSFTQASQVSDQDTYFAIIKRKLDAEVFAYGAGGFGTLQEYMILDRYVDMIRPSLILWQFCLNDFINNDPALETASLLNNNGWRRPYWVDGRIEYLLPKTWTGSLRIWAQRHSRFFHWMFSRWDRLLAMHHGQTVEDDIAREGLAHKGFQHAMDVTGELVHMTRLRVGDIPIVAFSCRKAEPYDTAFKTISIQSGVTFLPDIAGEIGAAHDRGEDVFHIDMGHWSVEGHRLAGSLISDHLRALFPNLFQPSSALSVGH